MESQESSSTAPSFQDGVAHVLMNTEELRQQLSKQHSANIISPHACLQVRHGLEELMPALFSLEPKDDDIEGNMRTHCHQRVAAVALQVLKYVIQKEEQPDEEANVDLERDCQAAIARIAELNLVLHENNDDMLQEIIDMYASYQKKVIRQRAKPAIARLVAHRKRLQQQHQQSIGEDEEDDEESSKSQHAHVITEILGQTSALIHPLLLWKSNLPPHLIHLQQLCQAAIRTLDEQAQRLTKTVATWFLEDRRVDDEWMPKSANETPCSNNQLAELDAVVEELAFCCQVFDRYIALTMQAGQGVVMVEKTTTTVNTIQEMHPEWTWKYASLERYLTHQQLQSALAEANPVQIVLFSKIKVPSVVEDAQYLSTRALERAASTRSTQAIGTVAHSIANDVWSTEMLHGVHEALINQKGCWQEAQPISTQESSLSSDHPTNKKTTTETKPSSSSFARDLLGALDNNDDHHHKQKKSSKPPSAPSSGTFLGSLSSLGARGDAFQRIRMDTYLCALNGIHSASSACSSLVKFLDSLLPTTTTEEDHNGPSNSSNNGDKKNTTMIQLAREELFRFSKNYQDLLHAQVQTVVTEFCGSLHDAPVYKGNCCIPVLRYYLERENYALPTSAALESAEDDARLDTKLIQPLRDSKLLQQFQKCDPFVLVEICKALAALLVDLFLDCITSQMVSKRFTDWGSLLLSKQVRTVQNHLTGLMEKALLASAEDQAIPIILPQWERLSQAVTVLQLEKPSDWAFYQGATCCLSADELERILRLRADFSSDAIAAVVASAKNETT